MQSQFAMLHNKLDRQQLTDKLNKEGFKRVTLSFYRYVILEETQAVRDRLFAAFEAMGVLGRIYVAREGINAQLSVPEHNFNLLRDYLDTSVFFAQVPFKIAVEGDGKSFIKLVVKVRPQIVADGLPDGAFDVTNVGRHLTAQEFNQAMDKPETVVVDMRNFYESEVGRFEKAILPDADKTKDLLPMSLELLKGKEEQKVLLYCTGGIRCEKASAYLRHHGFKDVNQLHGGIIAYAHQVKEQGLTSRFVGKNFVFDGRMGERIGNEIISSCHQCGTPCDSHVNCLNDDCHLLLIQCESCAAEMNGCCTPECKHTASLPLEEQLALRKGQVKEDAHAVFKSRRRPKSLRLK